MVQPQLRGAGGEHGPCLAGQLAGARTQRGHARQRCRDARPAGAGPASVLPAGVLPARTVTAAWLPAPLRDTGRPRHGGDGSRHEAGGSLRRPRAGQHDAVGAAGAEQDRGVVSRVGSGPARVGVRVHERRRAGRGLVHGREDPVKEPPGDRGPHRGKGLVQLRRQAGRRLAGAPALPREPLVQDCPDTARQPAGIDARLPEGSAAGRAEAHVKQPAGRPAWRAATGLVVRAEVVEAVPAAGFEFDPVDAAERGDLGRQGRRVPGHLRRGDAQRPRVCVAVGVAHRVFRVRGGEPVVVRDHHPRADLQPRCAQPFRRPLERAGQLWSPGRAVAGGG
jgi:hypothetical protein